MQNITIAYLCILMPFNDVKNVNFQMKNSDIFLIFAWGIDRGEFPRSVFWGGNKKIIYAPVKPQFYFITFKCEGIKNIQACCRDEDWQYFDHTMTSC